MGFFDLFKPKLTDEDLEDIQIIEEQSKVDPNDIDSEITVGVYRELLNRGIWQEQLPSGEWIWHKQHGPV